MNVAYIWHSGNRRSARRPHLPYVIFTEVIWGEQRVQEIWERCRRIFFPFPWVGFLSRFIAATFCAHAIFPVRFYAQLDRLNGDSHWKWGGEILKEDKRKAKEHRGPGAGWGSSLCCWSGCHITPCGDDCAIYCLAGAGDLRQRNHTRREGLSPLRCL